MTKTEKTSLVEPHSDKQRTCVAVDDKSAPANSVGPISDKTVKFDGIPLMPSSAKVLIRDLFKKKSQWRRKDLVIAMKKMNEERGGLAGVQKIAQIAKKTLNAMKNRGIIEHPAYATYRMVGSIQAQDEVQDEVDIKIEKSLGFGCQSVYVYYFPAYKKLATYEGKKTWPCKIGRTSVDVSERIYDQGISTAFVEEPIVGVVIKTDSSISVERALHATLDLAGKNIQDALGDEWYETCPEWIEKWYLEFSRLIESAK